MLMSIHLSEIKVIACQIPVIAVHLHALILYVDRGGLTYPSQNFTYRIFTVYRIVESILPRLGGTKKLTKGIAKFLTPYLSKCPDFCCKKTKSSAEFNTFCLFIVFDILIGRVLNFALFFHFSYFYV